ncbi:MAG TPA: hypothetical protein VLK28_01020 [Methylomirabilota bacterium]|nr:hypothetical protein [Methylomirabilota bacterium]
MRGWRAVRLALVAAVLMLAVGSGGAVGPDLADLVAAYLRAGAEQAPGAVSVRAYLEPTRPTAPPTPRPDVSVVLLPYSAQLEAELDAVKAGLRDSVDAYPRAVGRVETARIEYERALVAAGGGALVRSETTDGRGDARLGDLPPGDWLLLAWREGGHHTRRFKLRDQDAKRYPSVPTNVTYSTVTYWRSRLAVRPGETVEVTMSDRNEWMTGGRHESGAPTPARRPTAPAKQR